MLKNFMNIFVRKRHFWRDVTFDELAEIYTSMSLRSFGFSLIGIFVPIFLYKSGFSIQSIFLFYVIFFTVRAPVAYISAFVVGRIGPKHAIAISTVLIVAFLSLLLTLNLFDWPLPMLAIFFTVSNGLFFVAYNTDFSKVKDSKNGGKELGWLYIFERAGFALGPVVGGLMATLVSPEFTIGFAMVVLMSSLIPLFLTNEPVKTHQHISFKNFPWRNHTRDYVSLSAFHVENVASAVMWPFFIGVAIFTDDTYAKLGAVIGLAVGVSIISARMIGKIIDDRKGLKLLQYGVYTNAVTHVARSFITSVTGAVIISTVNEPVTLMYRMPLIKGFYDAADSEEGYRIVYIVSAEIITGLTKAAYCLGLFIACYFYNPMDVLRYSFIIVGFISLGILFQKFPALKKV